MASSILLNITNTNFAIYVKTQLRLGLYVYMMDEFQFSICQLMNNTFHTTFDIDINKGFTNNDGVLGDSNLI